VETRSSVGWSGERPLTQEDLPVRLAILVVASVVLFAGRPTAEAKPVAPADGYAFSVGASQIWMSPEDADRELDAAAKTHARWMRVHIDWPAIEKVQGAVRLGLCRPLGGRRRAARDEGARSDRQHSGVGRGARHRTLWAADQRRRLRHIRRDRRDALPRSRVGLGDLERAQPPAFPRDRRTPGGGVHRSAEGCLSGDQVRTTRHL
jgi:hypothetical protein